MKELSLTLLGILLGMLLFYTFSSRYESDSTEIKITKDTIVKIITPEPIVIEKVKTKIHFIRDTIIQTRPFVASVDTIIKRDTIRCFYTFPENLLSLKINQPQDSIITHHIQLTQTSVKRNSWWHDPLLILGGIISGYVIKSMEN